MKKRDKPTSVPHPDAGPIITGLWWPPHVVFCVEGHLIEPPNYKLCSKCERKKKDNG